MNYQGTFSVNSASIGELVWDAINRKVPFVMNMCILQYIRLITPYASEEGASSIKSFSHNGFSITGPTFIQPHIFFRGAGYQISEPLMGKLMSIQGFTAKVSTNCAPRNRNVCSMFH